MLPQKRYSKYNVRTDKAGIDKRTVNGIVFDSRLEAKEYPKLLWQQQLGLISDLQRQVWIPLSVNSTQICRVKVDFTYVENGWYTVHEIKGFQTEDWKIKWKLLQALYPQFKYKINGKPVQK